MLVLIAASKNRLYARVPMMRVVNKIKKKKIVRGHSLIKNRASIIILITF